MKQEEFEELIKPLIFLEKQNQRDFLKESMLENFKEWKKNNPSDLAKPEAPVMLRSDDVLDKAYEHLESEATDGHTTEGEKKMFIQGFLQGSTWMHYKIK